MPLTAIPFGNRLASGRARLVSPVQQLLPDLWRQGPEVLGEFAERDTVRPGGSAVGSHFGPSDLHVFTVNNLFHQIHRNVVQGWLLHGRRDRLLRLEFRPATGDWVEFFKRTRETDGRRKGLVEVEL